MIEFQPKHHAMNQKTDTFHIRPGQHLGLPGLRALLGRYAPEPDMDASSVYLRPGGALSLLEEYGAEGRTWREHLSEFNRTAAVPDTGVVGLRSGQRALVILPPFPVLENRFSPAWEVSPLLALADTEYTVGVVLLRLGRFSVAVYKGQQLLSSKTDARYVKSRHHAGGTSQKRFQRIREGQVRKLYDKTCKAAQRHFGGVTGELDFILLGGDKFTLDGFLKVCPAMESLHNRTLSRRLNVRDPKRDTLEQVGLMLNECRVYALEWRGA